VLIGAYTRWFDDWALLLGWAAGTVAGTAMAAAVGFTPTYALSIGGYSLPGYTALYTVILNLAIAIVLTPVFRALRGAALTDATVPADYHH
ncbi:MAG TPA: sodium:solute symporter, partial [Stellaceae bacterium]|nr:sodium:solute symporter [Stellaceae bacterium]